MMLGRPHVLVLKDAGIDATLATCELLHPLHGGDASLHTPSPAA